MLWHAAIKEMKSGHDILKTKRISVGTNLVEPNCKSHGPRGGGDSHMERTEMLVGNFEFNP